MTSLWDVTFLIILTNWCQLELIFMLYSIINGTDVKSNYNKRQITSKTLITLSDFHYDKYRNLRNVIFLNFKLEQKFSNFSWTNWSINLVLFFVLCFSTSSTTSCFWHFQWGNYIWPKQLFAFLFSMLSFCLARSDQSICTSLKMLGKQNDISSVPAFVTFIAFWLSVIVFFKDLFIVKVKIYNNNKQIWAQALICYFKFIYPDI